MNFWNKLFEQKKCVLGLSPMDGVTDAPFRYMVGKYSRPSPQSSDGIDVMFTEFVSVDALFHVAEKKKAEMVLRALMRARDIDCPMGSGLVGLLSDDGRQDMTPFPYEVAQIFGHTPELFYKAAVLVATLGFDGLDINMGCPASKVEELGSGAGLIRTPDVAKEIVRQAKKGIEDWVSGKVSLEDLGYADVVVEWVRIREPRGRTSREEIPVSVKTRIGVEREQTEEWIPTIMESEPVVLSLHGRTLKQFYQGKADWEAIGRAAEIVHQMGGKILGNGDVKSRKEAFEKCRQYGVDGVLIGRAAEGNPQIFAGVENPSKEQRLAWILEHARVYDRLFVENEPPDCKERAFMPLRKHLAWYAGGFPGASEMRQKLVMCRSLGEVERVISSTI